MREWFNVETNERSSAFMNTHPIKIVASRRGKRNGEKVRKTSNSYEWVIQSSNVRFSSSLFSLLRLLIHALLYVAQNIISFSNIECMDFWCDYECWNENEKENGRKTQKL